MKHLSDIEKWKLLAQSDVNQAASDFGGQPPEEAAEMADQLGAAYLVNVVLQLGTDAAAEILRNLPEDFRERVLKGLPQNKTAALKEILSYKPGTAGALMAKEYLSVPVEATLREATAYLQNIPKDGKGKISYIYVVDKDHRLEGVIQIRDLVFYASEKPIREILKSPVVQVETGMSQLEMAKLLQRHRYLGLPVVDKDQRLVGVINADSAMRVFEEEAADDIAKIVGTSAEEINAASVHRIVRLRLPWLLVSLFSGLTCAFISGVFQNNIQTVATLFLFIPVVLGLSESIGVQSATIVVRNLALGNVTFKQLSALFVKEAFAGIWIGFICGAVVGTVAYFWKANPSIGAALAASLVLAVILSAIIGLFLPVLFKRFKIDPAMASGPLVLAVCDIQTLIVYFNLSGAILKLGN